LDGGMAQWRAEGRPISTDDAGRIRGLVDEVFQVSWGVRNRRRRLV
jgi:3-mercaptopyruvate sulfurtransferase SseA